MKLHFKTLDYQLDAVKTVVDCFKGQEYSKGNAYLIDQGISSVLVDAPQSDMFGGGGKISSNAGPLKQAAARAKVERPTMGFANTPLFNPELILNNIQIVQSANGLTRSNTLIVDDNGKGKNLTGSQLNLDIEMETGTGKTYCYIRTMFELSRQYGWSKFIVVVPSIAIREGVHKSFQIMADHFFEQYHKKARFFIYDSKSLHQLESFSSDGGINVMIINVQAFNATGKDNRRIYEELDEFQSRRPIDVIKENNPILILDEPQKMGADKTLSSLANFNPLFILRYSATHKRNYNLVYRLDALDAYNKKLVKKITVKGIEVKGLSGTHGYLYLQEILISTSAPIARLEIEVATKNGFKREIRKIKKGDDLQVISNGAQQYHDRYVVSEIDARDNSVSFINGIKIYVGEALGHVDEKLMRTIQIRETIRAHFEKEKQLFSQGIKVLSLFFIDEVAKYRQYNEAGQAIDGEYVEIFKEQYENVLNETLDLNLENNPYKEYLRGINPEQTHNGYFSIDKRSKHLVDPAIDRRADEAYTSSDTDAYDLILKDKERLLSFEEPTRFIFSHSALREGWDNPNVFVICTLKHSDNVISRRQEVGRGLRLAVNDQGDRLDSSYFNGAIGEVHKLNNLTVVTNESYKEFVSNLQNEMMKNLASRPQQATPEYFEGKILVLNDGSSISVTQQMAKQIHKYLVKNDYIDDNDQITNTYYEDLQKNALAALPEPLQTYEKPVLTLIESIHSYAIFKSMVENANELTSNAINHANFDRKEFQALWARINRKAVYQINLDTNDLINKSIQAIDQVSRERHDKFVEKLTYIIMGGAQNDNLRYEDVENKRSFNSPQTIRETANISSIQSKVTYDLIGSIADFTNLRRQTVAQILVGINKAVFAQFKMNPEAFIREVGRIVNEQQARMVIQGLRYTPLNYGYPDNEIFVSNTVTASTYKATRHVWEYVATDSQNERRFAQALDGAAEVVVYAKLPDRFQIPTPFGGYNPDWAIVFEREMVRQIYFIAESKGSADEDQLRMSEKNKIDSAKIFFEALNNENGSDEFCVRYDVVDSFETLMKIVQ